ncbi:MAG: hypothetical protein KDD29_07980 [Flavobacteriales bacterium]|nr:hypothetical protein [Flavobacteriales bacterium]
MNFKNNKAIYLFILVNLSLLLLFWFRFSLRLLMHPNFHHFVHIFILVLLGYGCYLAGGVGGRMKTEWKRPMVTMGLIVIMLASIFYTSGITDREKEIKTFFRDNEQKLNELVIHYQKYGYDNELNKKENELNIELIYYRKGGYHFKMYSLLGYGYRVLYQYQDRDEMKIPFSPGGSPTYRWYKLGNYWYYYSYWD